jgi:hypothetical protein
LVGAHNLSRAREPLRARKPAKSAKFCALSALSAQLMDSCVMPVPLFRAYGVIVSKPAARRIDAPLAESATANSPYFAHDKMRLIEEKAEIHREMPEF